MRAPGRSQLCLLSKCYYAAAPILQQQLWTVDKDATSVTPRDLLLYHYYAGMIETGLKRFRSAVQFYTLAVSAPTHVLNAIMQEAYKKCLLCSLIDVGEPPSLPKYTSSTITRPIKSQLSAYSEFAEAFAAGKPEELRACLQKHQAAFAADNNLGLAKQCLPALMRKQIRSLTETYLTLSLSAIAEMVGLPDAAAAEKEVGAMIMTDEICAKIDQPRAMVHFHERPEKYDSPETLAAMHTAMGRAIGLATKLHELHSSLSVDQNYLARVTPRGGGGGSAGGAWDEDAMLSK